MPVLRALADQLDLDCLTVTGRTLGEEIAAAPEPWPQDVVRERDDPIYPEGGIAVLRGNLAPDGAIIKQSAATPALCRHTGRAVVFDSLADLTTRIDDPALDVTPEDVLVLRNAGPKGAPGMPEAGYIPIPRKLATAGVTDMVRLSDARMSGTAFGTIVLHACPEAAIGGPLSLVESGDRITLDVKARSLTLDVPQLRSMRAVRRGARRLRRRVRSVAISRSTWPMSSRRPRLRSRYSHCPALRHLGACLIARPQLSMSGARSGRRGTTARGAPAAKKSGVPMPTKGTPANSASRISA